MLKPVKKEKTSENQTNVNLYLRAHDDGLNSINTNPTIRYEKVITVIIAIVTILIFLIFFYFNWV